MDRLRAVWTVVQPQFFHLSALSLALGTAVAYWQYGLFDPMVFLLALASMACVHGGVNTSNEYFDFVSGADLEVVEETPFGGGTRVLPKGRLRPRTVLVLSAGLFAAGVALGLLVVARVGVGVLVLGAIGIVLGYSYTAPPLKLAYRSLGELLVGLAFGPIMVAGAFYVQTGTVTWPAVLVSLAPGLLNAAAIVCHRYPDYEPDRRAGKRTIVVALGKKPSSRVYAAVLWAAYVPPVLGFFSGHVPALVTLAALPTLPIAVGLGSRLLRGHDEPAVVNAVGARTMRLLWIMPGALTLAYLADAWLYG